MTKSEKLTRMQLKKRLISLKTAVFVICSLFGQITLASAYYQDRIAQNKDADVNITIMRWGVPDDDLDTGVDVKKDRIVGQVASDKHKTVTLIFESVVVDKKLTRLSVTTGVHVYDEGRDSYCTLCPRGRRDGYGKGTNSKGAHTSGGCYLEMLFPRNQALRKLRLVDVQANGQSVYYFTKFNVSRDLLKSPTRVPVSKKATLHPTEFQLEERDATTETKTGGGVADTVQTKGPIVKSADEEKPIIRGGTAVEQAKGAESGFVHQERKAFEEQTQKIAAQYKDELQRNRDAYSAALNALEKSIQATADLQGAVAVKKEKERFALTQAAPESALSENVAAKALQTNFKIRSAKLEHQRATASGMLAQAYLLRLKTIQDDYTRAGKSNDALLTNAEITRIKASSDYLYITNEIEAKTRGGAKSALIKSEEHVPEWIDITLECVGGIRIMDLIELRNDRLQSKQVYQPPVEIEYVCKTDSTNIRLEYGCNALIFNWERNRQELRIDGGPANRQHRPGKGEIPVNKFMTIRQVVLPEKMEVYVDDDLRATWQEDFSKVASVIGMHSRHGSIVTVKSIRVKNR